MFYTLSWISGGFDNIQLDIVGFLAILGEGSIEANAQVATLSRIIYLPRLLPAPQALLRPTRPSKLAPIPGYVTGIYSGNSRDYINHIGNVVVEAESLPEFSVKCVQINKLHKKQAINKNKRWGKRPSEDVKAMDKDEKGGKRQYEDVKANMYGPLAGLAVFGCMESCVLLSLSFWRKDGMALMATLLLSLLSTLIGFGNKWELKLPERKDSIDNLPPGNLVIRYPKGNFLVIECDENVARELFFAPENINYRIASPWKYRMVSLVGTLMLMFGVIFLGNATTWMQVGFAVAFMLLNAAYWIVAALPSKLHWNTACYQVTELAFERMKTPDEAAPPEGIKPKWGVEYCKTFTEALWKVICATRNIDWVQRSDAAPKTQEWDDWLHEALEIAKSVPSRTENQQPEKQQTEIQRAKKKWAKTLREENAKFQVPAWDPRKALKKLYSDTKAANSV
ncbi:hypothetical protein EJ06DRAFT_531776 [Trichodelitschia bisporula]|uniref:Uncharacterized protein n=1 Tax=Trichodelitschia bisporula TaxID=703511 RepID=A0A6G1HS63_9PEZI|nr:hypothetical protein EJ06DRAFT_531776 [Trichodelitschia bisporula]